MIGESKVYILYTCHVKTEKCSDGASFPSYVAAAGLPTPRTDHALNIVRFARGKEDIMPVAVPLMCASLVLTSPLCIRHCLQDG